MFCLAVIKKDWLSICLVLLIVGTNLGDSILGKFEIESYNLNESKILPRIIGAPAIELKSNPWLASIQFKEDDIWHHICAGTLITYQHVITVARYFVSPILDLNEFRIALGKHNLALVEPEEFYVRIKMVKFKKSFKDSGFLNSDMAILTLKEDLVNYDFDTGRIHPICFADQAVSEHLYGDYCYFSGWGSMNATKNESVDVRQTVLLAYTPMSLCQNMTATNVDNLRNHACGVAPTKDVRLMEGDFGGPFVCLSGGHYRLVGFATKTLDDRPHIAAFVETYRIQEWAQSIIPNIDFFPSLK